MGWLARPIGITADGPTAALVPALLLAPLAALALLAIFLPGARRSIPAVLLALTGLATAVASVHFQPAAAGAVALGPWPGSGLSLYWLGILTSLPNSTRKSAHDTARSHDHRFT